MTILLGVFSVKLCFNFLGLMYSAPGVPRLDLFLFLFDFEEDDTGVRTGVEGFNLSG